MDSPPVAVNQSPFINFILYFLKYSKHVQYVENCILLRLTFKRAISIKYFIQDAYSNIYIVSVFIQNKENYCRSVI